MRKELETNINSLELKIAKASKTVSKNLGDIFLIAVSKKKNIEHIKIAQNLGINNFGENYAQELEEKANNIDGNVCWHFIGPLQSNKAKIIAKYADWIHTIDRKKIADKINEECKKINKIINACIQVNISNESTKSGINPENLMIFAKYVDSMENINLKGIMVLPSLGENNKKQTSQDHKAVGEGDVGLNTGGMGAYSPAPIVDENIHQKIIDEVMTPTMHGLISEGSPYLGFLYAGLMIKDGEIKVLEFNCRFGDPETQPILLRLKSSLVELCLAAINDELESHEIEWTEKHSCGVVIASQGYPENYESNKLVSLPNSTENETKLFHAGTKLSNNEVLTSGGRVFCATALGDNLKEAQAKAYNLVDQVSFEGAFFRKDIGFKGIK